MWAQAAAIRGHQIAKRERNAAEASNQQQPSGGVGGGAGPAAAGAGIRAAAWWSRGREGACSLLASKNIKTVAKPQRL